jgi:chromosome segregation ATPase
MRVLHTPVQSPKDGLGRPFFVPILGRGLLTVCVWSCSVNGLAQETIYRCGNEYTNAPRDVSRCELLPQQAVTVISGIRPQSAPATTSLEGQTPDAARTRSDTSAAATLRKGERQGERDVQARTILAQELERVQKQHQAWVQEYRQGAPIKLATEHAAPQQYQERVTALKAAIERAERDIDSLQRELAARPVAVKTVQP